MNGSVKVVVGVMLVVLAGCVAPQKQLSREEWRALTTRHYDGVTADAVLDTGEKLFRLSDGDDYRVSYTDDSLQANRLWSVYLVLVAAMGTDNWTVKATPDAAGVRVTMQVSTQAGSAP